MTERRFYGEHALHAKLLRCNALWSADCGDKGDEGNSLSFTDEGDRHNRTLWRECWLEVRHSRVPPQASYQVLKLTVDYLPNSFPANALQQARGNALPIFHEGAQRQRIEHQFQKIPGRGPDLQIDQTAKEPRRRRICTNDVPMPIQNQCGVRFMLLQHSIDRLRDDLHLSIVQRRLCIDRSVTGSQ